MIRSFGAVTGLTNQPQGLDVGLGGGSNIKSIQRGKSTIPASGLSVTATISSIVPANSIVKITISDGGANATNNLAQTAAAITNATTLTFNRNTSGTGTVDVYWEVAEFNNVKSKQSGIRSLSAITGTTTVTAVDLAKSMLFISFITIQAANFLELVSAELTNATTVTFVQANTNNRQIYWQLIEFN